MENTLVFIHGLESSSQGIKGQFFSKNFPQMIVKNYKGKFATRMRKLNRVLAGETDLIIVGSSYGGLMAVAYAIENEDRIKKLILLAPALTLPEFKSNPNEQLKIPVIIYHGINDDVVNPENVKNVALKCFSNLEHHLVEDDHSLHKTFPILDWKKLLVTG
ncbi:MAG: alpha/beta hydrolase [Syntrophaceae bacterium]|nr:alpha/beta hydrolase [Syntrophaceae bacterium]